LSIPVSCTQAEAHSQLAALRQEQRQEEARRKKENLPDTVLQARSALQKAEQQLKHSFDKESQAQRDLDQVTVIFE
jgi:hypothetical protein